MFDSKSSICSHIKSSECWTIDDIKTDDFEPQKVIRKFINSAIYVEKPLAPMSPYRKGPLHCQPQNTYKVLKVKRCSCSINSKNCPCHPHNEEPEEDSDCNSNNSSKSNLTSDIESQITVKQKPTKCATPKKNNHSDVKLSLSKLTTTSCCTMDNQGRDEAVKSWLTKKEEEKRKKLQEQTKLKEIKEKERQKLIEKERENFRKWLMEKKMEEERKKKNKEQEMEEEKLKELEKEKKQLQNQINYQIWLQRKQKHEIEKKMQEKMLRVQKQQDEKRRMEENKRAFQEWVRNSRNKPKPIPLNQGLKSLCSSASITYINPVPWTPNINIELKPTSQ